MTERVWNPNVKDLHKYILDLEAEVERLKKRETDGWHEEICASYERTIDEQKAALARVRTELAQANEVIDRLKHHLYDITGEPQ